MDKNNHDHHHGGGGFMNGFLLGVIVGAAVVFLFATKKGKQILKTLTENGFEGVSEISDLLSSVNDDDEEYEEEYMAEDEGVPTESVKPEVVEVDQADHPHSVHHTHHPRPLKRLFRGVRK